MKFHEAKIFIRIAALHLSCWYDLPRLQEPVQLKVRREEKVASL